MERCTLDVYVRDHKYAHVQRGRSTVIVNLIGLIFRHKTGNHKQ